MKTLYSMYKNIFTVITPSWVLGQEMQELWKSFKKKSTYIFDRWLQTPQKQNSAQRPWMITFTLCNLIQMHNEITSFLELFGHYELRKHVWQVCLCLRGCTLELEDKVNESTTEQCRAWAPLSLVAFCMCLKYRTPGHNTTQTMFTWHSKTLSQPQY